MLCVYVWCVNGLWPAAELCSFVVLLLCGRRYVDVESLVLRCDAGTGDVGNFICCLFANAYHGSERGSERQMRQDRNEMATGCGWTDVRFDVHRCT